MLRKTVKKIMALGTGATMVGATILGATAADLKDYPAPFVKDGKFNALIVVGDEADSSDVIGSVDVATSLQFASRVRKSVQSQAGTTVTVTGDAWRVGTSTKKLELTEGNGQANETIRNIQTFIDEDELAALNDGKFESGKNTADFEQFIHWDYPSDSSLSGTVRYVESDDDVTSDFFFLSSSKNLGRYVLEFKQSSESVVTDSSGGASTSGLYLWDFEGKDISFLGNTWSIVKARRSSAAGASAELTLMQGAIRDVLSEGDTKTYTIGGKDYELLLKFVGTTTAKFTVNGEVTDSLTEGSTDKLADGTEVGVRDILSQEFAGGTRQAEFYLGAQKVFFKDTDIKDKASSNTLEVGSEKIDDANVHIEGTDDNSTFKLDKIIINISADDDFYVAPGEKLSSKMSEPQALLDAWDIRYDGLAAVESEAIRLRTNGKTKYELEFQDGSNNKVSLPLAYSSSGTNLKLGDNDDDLLITENATISKNDYFIVFDESQDAGREQTYGFRYKGADRSGASSPTIKFQDLGTGETVERTYTAATGNAGEGTADANIKVGGQTYKVWNATGSSDLTADFNIVVDLDGDQTLQGNATANTAYVTTHAGARIFIGQTGPNTLRGSEELINGASQATGTSVAGGWFSLNMSTPNADDYDNQAPSTVAFNITAASGEMNAASATGLTFVSPSGKTNIQEAYTSMGAFVTFESPTSAPDLVTIDYPKQQRLPLLFVTAGAVETEASANEAGQIVYYETSPVEVGSAKLASEVANVRAQNTILVGGPCINPAAADVMGNPAVCTAGFEEGKAKLKLFEHSNGNVALLVAGFSAMDTRRAARVLANSAAYAAELKGTEVEVAGTSFTDITVSAPVVMAAEPAAAAPAAEATS